MKNNTFIFFNGQNLNFWHTDAPAAWKVEKTEIVATSPKPSLLIGELLVTDEFHAVAHFDIGKEGRAAIRVLAEEKPGTPPTGPSVDLVPGEPVAISLGGKTIASTTGNKVKTGEWNKLEILAANGRVRIRLNDHDEIDTDAIAVSSRNVIGLETHSPAEVRFRHLDMRLQVEK